ncbi:MAG: hypothetical protein NTW99_09760 [Chloroflexi bacterium]|nr:hypothetical protein [Chloroflexota bacterium]
MHNTFGPIALLGSGSPGSTRGGETYLAGGRIFETIAQRQPRPVHSALLETPAGFELNSPQVAP